MTTQNHPRENAHMNLGIGFLIAIVAGLVLKSIGLGLVFALTLKADKASD